ncbi:MAG: FHA domain-containing protein [Desulfobacula sp.]|nr:FHA domain-containing protein [Desulfobacula sp.]
MTISNQAKSVWSKIKLSLGANNPALHPVQIAGQLKKEAENKKLIFAKGVFVPDKYVINISSQDFKAFAPFIKALELELVEELQTFFKKKNYQIKNLCPKIKFMSKMILETGTIQIISSVGEPESSEPGAFFVTLKINPGASDEHKVSISSGSHVLGRGRNADVLISKNDNLVSKTHCRLDIREKEVFVTDLSSSNGTVLNGRIITRETRLEPDSKITAGKTMIEVNF